MDETRRASALTAPPHDVLRLAVCPGCGGRARALTETHSVIRARCLGCGADLAGPLDVEITDRTIEPAGRGGQRLLG